MNSPSKILVVDRNPVLLNATRRVLESAGYEIFQALSGEDVFAVVREIRPNLVLLDANPEAPDALDVCRRIKADQSLAGIYVILLSESHTDTESRAQGLELGASDYIVRPVGGRELLARVQAMLRIQQVERALQASEKRFRALVENNSDAITLLDAKGIVLYDSPAAPGMLGYSPEDWIGRDVFSLIHPDDLPKAQEIFQNLVKSPGERVRSTFRVRHKSGESLWIELVATNFLSEPDVSAIVLNYRDITEQKQNETINAARLRLARFSLTHSLNELLEETLNETEKLTDSLIGFYHFVEDDQKSLTLQNWSTRTKTEFCKAEGQGLHYAIDVAGVWVDCIRQGKAVIHNDYASLPYRKGMPEGHATIIRELVVPVFRGDKISAVLGVGNKPTDYSEKDVETVSLIANLAWEIAVRKQAEEALRESEDKFKYIFEHSLIGKSITQVDGEINVNQAFCDMLGYSPEELKNRTWQEISHPDDLELTQTEINNILSNQCESTRFIKRYLHKNGSVIWAEVSTALRRDADGKPLYFLTSINDITARKQAELAFQASNTYLQAVLDSVTDAVFVDDADTGQIIDVNQGMCEMYGYSRAEALSIPIGDLSQGEPPYSQTEALEWLRKAREIGPQTFEWLAKHKNGRLFWAEVSTRFAVIGGENRFVVVVRNINERKQAETAQRQDEQRMRAVIDNAPYGAFIYELMPDQRLVFRAANQAADSILGIECQQFIGKNIEDAFPPLAETEIPNAYRRVALTGERYNKEQVDYDTDNIRGAFEVHAFQTGPNQMAAFFRDITERKRAEDALLQSEERFRLLFNQAPLGYQSLDSNGNFLEINQAWLDMLGYRREEVLGRWFGDFLAPGYVAAFQQRFPIFKAAGQIHSEFKMLHKNGGLLDIAFEGRVSYDRKKEFKQTHCILEDITARKQAEEALKLSNELLSLFIQHSPIYAFIKEVTPTESRVLKASENFEEMIGIPGSQMVGKSMQELFPPELAKTMTADDWAVASGGQVLNLEEDLNGRSYTTIKFPIQLGGKHLLAGYTIDLTERKKAEEALRQSETFNRSILENSPIGISVRSQTGKLISANNAWRKIWAMSDENFLADQQKERQALNFDTRDNYLAPHIDAVRRVYEQGEHLHLPELKVTNPRPGAAEWIAQHFYAIQDEQGQVQQVVILTEDITERKRAEEALNESKLLFQLLIESLPQNIYAKDVDGRFIFANQRYCITQGKTLEEIVGKTDFELHPPKMAEKYRADDRRVIETGKTIELEEEHQPVRGEKSIVQVIKTPFYGFNGQTAGTLGIFWDITERKQAEETLKEYNTRLESAVEARTRELRDTQEKLVRQEKLAVLGQLAGSVGHELRNPLGIINNAVYFLRLVQPDANEMIKEYLGIIETETRTADMIISDLLDFSRVKSVDLKSVSVADLVGRTLERFPAPPNVQVSLKLPEDLPNAYVDPRQMTQVLGNLVLNACQAMPQGGTLTLSAKKKDEMMALSVADTGSGITPENMKKLFEPLFTTKPKGIGLGLAVSKKLVDANGGQLEVQSEVGKGTTFTVRLPISIESGEPSAR